MNQAPAPVLRTQEIEEVTNRYVVHPLSRLLVRRLARWGVHPNTVSLLGMALGGAAALAYFHYESAPMVVLGFVLMLGWHVMDGADGQLARLTGKTSELGRVLDGLCDHVAFTLVYLSLALALTPRLGLLAWGLAALAGASHLVQAGAYEFQRHAYDHWGHAKPSSLSPNGLARRQRLGGLLARLDALYLALQRRFAVLDPELNAQMAASLADDEAAARRAYREANAPALRRWNLLSSNYRTIAIFAACLARRPEAYFLFEIVVLNVALVLLVRMQRARQRALLARLEAPAPPERVWEA